MGPFGAKDLEEAVAAISGPMIYTPMGPALDRIAGRLQRTDSHTRLCGYRHRPGRNLYLQASPLTRDLAARKSVQIEGIMMTFTEDPQFDAEQLKRFLALCSDLKRGDPAGKRHAASSFALFQRPDAFLDMVRPGMALFGIHPDKQLSEAPESWTLHPALALKARVAYVKKLASWGECRL